ncbi:MAG: hypothetical protein V7607_224 [Solirubrobacteraceae bacterium]
MLKLHETRTAVACGMALAMVAAPQAMASGEGTNARLGVRNPSSGNLTVQTQIIASNSNWGTRQSNKGAGGGAIYGCRSAPGAESCVRAVNLMNGIAFSFQSNSGSTVGSFQVGTTSAVNPNATPFTTNAAGKVTNLNADHVDGLSASQIESEAVSTAVSQAGTAAKALSSIAAVSAAGALQKARGASASSQTGTGAYLVTFPTSIASCVYQATINSAGGAPGFVSATEATATSVSVSTFNVAGVAANLPFSLTVNC